MSAFRVASTLRAAPRAFALPRTVVARRGYADIADDRLKLSLTLPHQVCQRGTATLCELL